MLEKRHSHNFIGKKKISRHQRIALVAAFCVIATGVGSSGVVSALKGFSRAHTQIAKQVTTVPAEPQPEVLGAFTALVPTPSDEPTLNPLIESPNISAQSALLFQLGGPVLYSRNPDTQVPIASLTKLMTALIVMQDPRHTQPITITAADHVTISPILHLRTVDSVYPDDLIHAMLVGSANDAALTLANHFSIPELSFIQRMNVEANSLGMTQTMFSTPIGFDDPQNYSTARDLRKLINAALPVLPFAETDQADSYTFHSADATGGSYSIQATSHLPDDNASIHVLKTGFTDDAKQAMISETEVQGRTIISIVLQSDNRDTDSAALLQYAAKAYVWPSK